MPTGAGLGGGAASFEAMDAEMDAADMTLASLPARARRLLRCTALATLRVGPVVFSGARGDDAPARDERRRRRRGRSSEGGTVIVGSTESSWIAMGAEEEEVGVGVVSMGVRARWVARGVAGERESARGAEPGVMEGSLARRPEEKKEE